MKVRIPIKKFNMMRSFLKKILPPALRTKITGLFYGWHGNYMSWEEAERKCSGYGTEDIHQKVKDALLQVKNGTAVYERDSVLFDKIEYLSLIHISTGFILRKNIKKNGISFLERYHCF